MPPQAVDVATQTANNLATKDDRYLMIYAVVLLILGGAAIIYKLAKFLEKVFEKQSSQTETLIKCVSENTTMIGETRTVMKDCTELIRKFPPTHIIILWVVGLFFGCASLDKDADPVMVRAEQFQTVAASTFDFVLNVQHSNPAFYRTNAPSFYNFCEWLKSPVPHGGTNLQRVLAMQWNIQEAKRDYKNVKSAQSKDLLNVALKVGEKAIMQANSWSNIVTLKR